jgi:hypothetical protein
VVVDVNITAMLNVRIEIESVTKDWAPAEKEVA